MLSPSSSPSRIRRFSPSARMTATRSTSPKRGISISSSAPRCAEADRGADEEIEMPLFGDVERVAVIRAEGEKRRILDGDELGESMQVLRHRAFPDQHGHALGELLTRLPG